MNQLKIAFLSAMLCMSFGVSAYQNQCTSVFVNGMQSHGLGVLKMDRGAQLINGSTASLFAKKVKLHKRTANESCALEACTANGTASIALPQYALIESKWKDIHHKNGHQQKQSKHSDTKHSKSDKHNKHKNAKPTVYSGWFSDLIIDQTEYKNIVVQPFSTATLAHSGSQFSVEKITVAAGSRIVLKPGDYWVENFHLSMGAKIETSDAGQVRIFAKKMSGSYFSQVGSDQSPHQILIVSKTFSVASTVNIYGYVYAHKSIKIGYGSYVLGAISSKNIHLNSYAVVDYFPDNTASINFAWICDFDNDGIYDGQDNDADNDGFDNALEILAGSSIYDPEDVPADLDSDGTPDVIDLDIDGDGYSNEQEIADGTDPYDSNSYQLRPPTISLTIASDQTVENEQMYISGMVVQGDLSISRLFVHRVGSPNDIQLINLNTDGSFTSQLSLNEGSNAYIVTVEDSSGEQVQINFNVTYIIPFQLVSVAPATDTEFSSENITIMAVVKSNLEPKLRINNILAEQQVISENMYQYTYPFTLLPGLNKVELNVSNGKKSFKRTLAYTYKPSDMTLYPAPEVSIITPGHATRTSQAQQPLTVNIISNVGGLTATLNSLPISINNSGNNQYTIAQSISLVEGQNQFVITVIDALGQQSTQSMSITRDSTAPVITIDQNYLLPPSINMQASNSVLISGKVTADDLSSLSIAGQQVSLQQIDPTHYGFEQTIKIPVNQDTLVAIQAKDTLANSSVMAYYFNATNNLNMSWVTPVFPVQWILEMGNSRPFAIKLHDASGNENYSIQVIGPQTSMNVPFTKIDELLTGTFNGITTKGDFQVIVTATDNGQVVSQITSQLSVISQDDLPIEITQVLPAAESRNLEPDVAMQVNFNRPLDFTKLNITARRTLHGKTYVNLDASGVDFLHAKGMQLVQVDVDREMVAGNLAVLPGDSSFLFYPSQDLGYNSQVEWVISYDGQELSKQRFNTRDLPTVIDGGVQDTFSQRLEGVTVEIEELGLKTITNSDGGYSFGYGAIAEQNIPAGQYHLLVNRGYVFPQLGEIRIPVDIKQGRRNQLSLLRAPNMSNQVQWMSVPRDTKSIRLAQGELEIELLNTSRIEFPTGHNAIHAQFITASNLVRDVYPGSAPLWFYQLQPFGIKSSGPINIKMKMATLNGTTDYMMMEPGGVKYSFLLGYSPSKDVIEPIGVVKIENGFMETLHPVEPESFDYFGYTHTRPEYQEQFNQYVNSEISFIELMAKVTVE
jgi:hypothetical protein